MGDSRIKGKGEVSHKIKTRGFDPILVLARVEFVDLALHGGLLLGELIDLQAVGLHRGGQCGHFGGKLFVHRDARSIRATQFVAQSSPLPTASRALLKY